MIQLRSALEELGRIRRTDVGYPAWQSDPSVREQLDGPTRAGLLDKAPSPGQKALLLGASWPRLAVDLAERGVFVTVADDDARRNTEVSRLAGSAGQLGRITVTGEDYKDTNFEASAFNLIVAWDTLNTYSEFEPLLKKIVRELKAGGRLFLRVWVRPEPGSRRGLRRALRSVLPLLESANADVLAADTFLMPERGALDRISVLSALEKLLVVHGVEPQHAIAADLADLIAGVAPGLLPALSSAMALDRRILVARPGLARFLAVGAVKEKQLGRVFRANA